MRIVARLDLSSFRVVRTGADIHSWSHQLWRPNYGRLGSSMRANHPARFLQTRDSIVVLPVRRGRPLRSSVYRCHSAILRREETKNYPSDIDTLKKGQQICRNITRYLSSIISGIEDVRKVSETVSRQWQYDRRYPLFTGITVI